MTNKQLIRLALVLVIILIAWGALALGRRSSASSGDAFSFPAIDTAAVDTIAMAAPRDTIVLARDAHGTWRVNGYPAAPTLVSSLLKAFDDSGAWSELVAEQHASHARLGVDTSSGRRVRVVSGDRAVVDVVTGERTGGASGIYLRRADGDAVYAFHGALVGALNHHGVDAWRNRRIAAAQPARVATIALRRGGHGYELRRKDGRWTFASGQPADSAAVSRLLDEYQDLRASGFATAAQADSADFTQPRLGARLLDAEGEPLVDLAFDSTASGVWARADSGGTVFQVASWRLPDLIPGEGKLRAKGKP